VSEPGAEALKTVYVGETEYYAWVIILATGSAWRAAMHTVTGAYTVVMVSVGTALVTAGLFAHIRNPIFTGMLAVTTGLTLMVPTVGSVAAVACLLIAVQIQVRAVEEPYLLASHGPTYRDYASHAGRFLPRIGRLTPRPSPTAKLHT
jgi:protein-S-isoprenylcysteine O-methyltransferase Ste14